jgi:nitrogen fixation NifU-like protein
MNDDLRELYQNLILDHGKNPRNFRAQEQANCEMVGHNPLCGDKLVLYLTVGEEGTIADASFQGEGCAISMASASMMTDMLKGKTAAQARTLFAYFHDLCTEGAPEDIDATLLNDDDKARLNALSGVRLYPMRVKCAVLPWRTLQAALDPKGVKRVKTE